MAPDAGGPAGEATTLGPVTVRLPAGFEVVDVPDASVLDRFGARREDATGTAVLAVVWRRDGALPAAEDAQALADRVGAVAEEVDVEGATEAWQVAYEREAPTGHGGQLAASRAVSVAADVDAGVVVVEALAPVAAYDASGLPEALHSLTAVPSWRG